MTMLPAYYIQFRFRGSSGAVIRKLIDEISHAYDLETRRVVPHITFAGPFNTKDETRLISDFNTLCQNSLIFDFEVNGYGLFEEKKVLFLDVHASKAMQKLRRRLSAKLRTYCELSSFDFEHNFAFHATIYRNLPENKYVVVREQIRNKPSVQFRHLVARLTLLKNGLILREYDFFLRQLLTREQALSKQMYDQTMNLLMQHLKK
jgi:2'-5' RNA ligase